MGTAQVTTPTGSVSYAVTGDGPALVLLAGLGSTHRVWGDLPRVLADRFTVIAPDNRGVGGSRGASPFTLELAAADVVAVLDHAGARDAVVLGASMGGLIALRTAIDHPDAVSGLVLASCAVRSTTHGRRVMRTLRDLVAHLPPERVGAALMTFAFGPPCTNRFPQLVQLAAEGYGLDPADRAGAAAQADHLLEGFDMRSAASRIPVPALVLAGRRDPLVAVEDTLELARCLPSAQWYELADGAHSVLAEGGREILDSVVRFASRIASGPSEQPPE